MDCISKSNNLVWPSLAKFERVRASSGGPKLFETSEQANSERKFVVWKLDGSFTELQQTA